MSENVNIALTVEAWAEITIKEWINKAAALGISPDNPLTLDRFVHHVITNSNGDPQRVEFAYDYYLNFIDWGVGNGVTIENRDLMISSGATTRRPKMWFTEVFYKQVKILSHLLAEKMAQKAVIAIKMNLMEYNSEGFHIESKKHHGSVGRTPEERTKNRNMSVKEYNRLHGN